VVLALFAAFGAGDLAGVLALVSPEAEWRIPGPELIPFAGTHRGPEGVRHYLESLVGTLEFLAFELLVTLSQGEQVVVQGREVCRVRRNGARFENRWLSLWRVRNGLVVSLEMYEDTADTVAALLQETAERDS